MKLRTLGAAAGAFSHLLGRKKAEEEKKPPAETAEEDPDEGDESTENEDPEEEKKDPDAEYPDGKDAEEDPEEEKAEARGAAAERARCRAIFASPAAANNIALAAHLAFDTSLTAKEAVGALKLGGRSNSGGLGARMAAAPNPSLGAGEPRQASQRGALMAGWDAAFKKAGIATTSKA